MKNLKYKKTIVFASMILFLSLLFVNIEKIKGNNKVDIAGKPTYTEDGCEGQDSCWGDTVNYGIRLTIVDSSGNKVDSTKSIDYVSQNLADLFNQYNIYKCETLNDRMSYLNGKSECNLTKEERQFVNIPDIFTDNNWFPGSIYTDKTAISQLKTNLLDMSDDKLEEYFFRRMDYKTISDEHYLIIEPITAITVFGKGIYYGTYYELANLLYTNTKINWAAPAIISGMPQSLYIEGDSNIKGYNNNDETYFNSKLKIAYAKDDNCDTLYNNNTDPSCVFNKKKYQYGYGYGIGIFHISQFKINPPTPNCKIDPTIKSPLCSIGGSYGEISDIDNWSCIYQNDYFRKDNAYNNSCPVYCRDKIVYNYPGNEMNALAGTYFTIGNQIESYKYYIDNNTNTTKVNAATLGPISVTVTRECSIKGHTNGGSCTSVVDDRLNNLKSPTINFSYQSDYYKNPKETLKATATEENPKIEECESLNGDYCRKKTITYTYSLPDNTYKYVSKNTGKSYKTKSDIGNYPYITIGNHLPIHFSQKSGILNFEITINDVNLNFSNEINNSEYKCNFNVENKIIPTPEDNKDINIIFRTISLDNPFPGKDGEGRKTGRNWCNDDNCKNNNPVVKKYITNNRDVKTEEIYKKTPLYKITLTPALIQEIRKYNDKNNYDDFNLDCNENGTQCKSKFIRGDENENKYFSSYFSGCGIKGKASEKECNINYAW